MAQMDSNKGYVIALSDGSDFYIDGALHIERDDSLIPWKFDDDKRFNFNRDKAALFQALHYRYYNYDLDKPFLPQYISNMAALQQFLWGRLGEV